jgi:single-stranded-DNA-specific exonuclease
MKWVLAESDAGAAERLAAEAGLHPLIARLMVNRGIADPAAARSFLSSDLSGLSDPRIFPHMEQAVQRIRVAVSKREPVVVYGDYDVDGVTGCALLYLALRELGAAVTVYLPNRLSEGYGLNREALRKIKTSGAGLVITVDCGISAREEAGLAREIGLDLIITDHHEVPGAEGASGLSDAALPPAQAIIHPMLLPSSVDASVRERVRGLTGVGVAFKLAQALLDAKADDERLRPFIGLVTLGTVADVGRITGENRVLVRHGLEVLSADSAALGPGIRALKRVAGLVDRKVSVGNVGFALAPRINASGRLESADVSFRLFTTDSPTEAEKLAEDLDAVNRERQSVEETIAEEARRMARRLDLAATGAFVLASPDWHPGVVGIVASRIADEFYRPAALIAVKDGIGKGSARSIPGFDLYHALTQCHDLLLGYGGHTYAAGFSVAEEKVEALRERLSSLVLAQFGSQGFVRTLMVDGTVTLEELTLGLVSEIEKLAPFGQGNPEPRLGCRGLIVQSSRVVGNNHLKLRLRQDGGAALSAIAFSRGNLHGRVVREGSRVAAVFTPKISAWNGTTGVELEIRDLKVEKGETEISNRE